MPRVKKQEDEAKADVQEAGQEGSTGETAEETKSEAVTEPILIETKGKFRLFKTSGGYKILDDYSRLISCGEDMKEGTRMLNGLTRR